MKILRISLVVVLVLLAGLAILAPVGPLPGLFIGGQPTVAPARWPDTSAVHEIRLRVPGTLPRVVIVWVVEHDGDLHVVGARNSGWVSMLGAGGPVEMRLGDNTYSLNAALVTDGWEDVLNAYVAKYRPDYPEIIAGFPSIEDAKGTVAVYRLGLAPPA
jgi:hypothetical protein